MYRPRQQERPGNFLPRVNKSPDAAKKFASANSMAKSIRYKTDGSGRDSYVNVGDGGFTNPMKAIALDPRVAFQRSLRGYDQDGEYLARRQRRMQLKNHRRNQSNIIGANHMDLSLNESSSHFKGREGNSMPKFNQSAVMNDSGKILGSDNLRVLNDMQRRRHKNI